MSTFKKKLIHTYRNRLLQNLNGINTSRKIVVIESDDWGVIRSVKNKKDLDILRAAGIKVDNCHYMLNDNLLSSEDLECLFEEIVKISGKDGQNPIITANTVVRNPNFEKIAEDNFSKYFSKSLNESFTQYFGNTKPLELWFEGIEKKIFMPQSHGREHLNISRWMHDLRNGNKETLLAFKLGVFGLSGHIVKNKRCSYLAALDLGIDGEEYDRSKIVSEALKEFKQVFGFDSKSFIAPNYVWDETIEKQLGKEKVEILQGQSVQYVSRNCTNQLIRKKRKYGEKTKFNQMNLVRNCFFEPSEAPQKDWVDSCLNDIRASFLFKKPAVISTHRVNFSGALSLKNRDNNLKRFKQLLTKIVDKWPDVEFRSSADFANSN